MASASTPWRDSMLSDMLEELRERCREGLRVLDDTMPHLKNQEQCQGPHRCWPSRWGWGAVIFLLVYLLIFHSTYQTEILQRQQLGARLERVEQRLVLLEQPPVGKKPWWHRR